MNYKGFKHLTTTDRLRIEECVRHKRTPKQIAEELGCSVRTVYYELKRGATTKKVGYYDHYQYERLYKYKSCYEPSIAENRYREFLKAKGADLKIGKDFELANYIEKRIADDKLTPLAVLGEIKKKNLQFNTSICLRTLYSYIEKGVFLRLSNENLPIKRKKRKKKKHKKTISRAPRGTSIEQRPAEIAERREFGHWEMDCVVGTTLDTLLNLSERVTRKELIFKIPSKRAENVVAVIDSLERKYGGKFSKVFKSITVDNGGEFSDCEGLEKSKRNKEKEEQRTKMYYCHPYSSSERATNERLNREVRRIFPKKTNFKHVTKKQVKACEDWMNNYPRQVLGFATPNELFAEYMKNLK